MTLIKISTVKSIFEWLDGAEDNEKDILSVLDDLADLEAVADIMKDTEVGEELKIWPRMLDGLHKRWQLLQK